MNAERLMRLARFLHNTLPEHKFLFSSILRGSDIPNGTFECGTVGCAIGWAPLVFPEDLKYVRGYNDSTPQVIDSKSHMVLVVSQYHASVALQEFFGITTDEAQVLFMPNGQRYEPDTPTLQATAKPKEVARNIALLVSKRQPEYDTTL